MGDRYTLIGVLGGGGMARVYLARDEVLGREVALKVLRERYADDEGFVERFRREARSAASLNHPNVVQVYDQGQAKDGAYYIAMEHVPGGTLKDRIEGEGRLAPAEAAGIASRVAAALEAAHAKGIVHRDVKPQNVLLCASGEAKVADFGIARAASSKTITETDLVLGTAAYMSPEQVRGERVGPASDLYSLGVVLYEMLTGELPFRSEDPIATAMKHVNEPPPHPAEANPAVPGELDALVVKLLAKRPEDRYPSAGELAEDLLRTRDGLPPLAAGSAPTAPLRENTGETRVAPAPAAAAPVRTTVGTPRPSGATGRRRGLLPLLALLLVGVALLGGISWALSRDSSDPNPSTEAGGAGRVEVPDVVGLEREEARGRIEEADLEPGPETEAPSDEVAAGAVSGQDPPAGTTAERGAAVSLVLSTGPAPPTTTQTPSNQDPSTSPGSSTSPASAEPSSPAPPSPDPSSPDPASPDPASPDPASPGPASPAADGEEAGKAREKARKEAEKAAEERQKELEKAAKEAEKAARPARGGKKGK